MLLSIVIPVYNEAESLPALISLVRQVLAKMDCQYEFVFVNDGSEDDTLQILRQEAELDARIKVLVFSRNFGHQLAITAGLDVAAGDAVVVMDADLQDPPEILSEMFDLFRHGYDVVSAQRVSRESDSFFKKATAAMFYWLIRRMVNERVLPQVGDFRLFSRGAVTALRRFREQHRFMRGLVAWLGLKEVIVPFHRPPRVAGTTKYSTLKMLRFAWTAISSFSGFPLRVCMGLGILMACPGFLFIGYALFAVLVQKKAVPGWTSVVCLQAIFSGAILLSIGLVGDYVARIYEEAKGRPLYIVAESLNLEEEGRVERAVFLPPRNLNASAAPEDGVAARTRGVP
jgi:polyisoprenyl-phosphate glycosyltransferase